MQFKIKLRIYYSHSSWAGTNLSKEIFVGLRIRESMNGKFKTAIAH